MRRVTTTHTFQGQLRLVDAVSGSLRDGRATILVKRRHDIYILPFDRGLEQDKAIVDTMHTTQDTSEHDRTLAAAKICLTAAEISYS